jgi:pectate lyase
MRVANIITIGLGALLHLSQAVPVVKRASADEAASVGFATQNGGTTGGAGGSTVTVSSLSDLQTAVSGDDPAIVIVSGTITGATAVKIGSNKTVPGKDSNASKSNCSHKSPYH